jgi:hypothetical protein
MRVLNRAIAVLCAAGAVAVADGCFAPTVADCQFTCGADNACPAGTSCMGGFCRDTTTGTCTVSTVTDAARPDGTTDATSCPSAPCGATGVAVTTGGCAALCTQQVSFAGATELCGSDSGATAAWHIAILDTAAKRTAFGEVLPTSIGWIGLSQTATIWHWLNAASEVQATTEPPWASGEPSATNPYGLFDSTGHADVLRSGSGSDTHAFFCEYRP